MATVKLGLNVTDMRGKAGQMVFSRNGSAQTVRAWNYPVRQGNALQVAKRSWLGRIRHGWETLDQAGIDLWDAFAASPPEIDHNRVGDLFLLSGSAWHTRINMRRLQVGDAIENNCPANVVVDAPISFSLVVYSYENLVDESTVDYTSGDFDGFNGIVQTSVVRSMVRQRQTAGYKSVYGGLFPSSGPVPVGTLLKAVYPSLLFGMRVFCRVYKQSSSGIRSLPLLVVENVRG